MMMLIMMRRLITMQFFDRDGNGEIDVAELRTTMSELGGLLSDQEIADFIAVMDVNNDGVIGVSMNNDGVIGVSVNIDRVIGESVPPPTLPALLVLISKRSDSVSD